MEKEIKACPFCGISGAYCIEEMNDYFVKCFSCETMGPIACNEDVAIEAWNTRKQNNQLRELDEEEIEELAQILHNDTPADWVPWQQEPQPIRDHWLDIARIVIKSGYRKHFATKKLELPSVDEIYAVLKSPLLTYEIAQKIHAMLEEMNK